MFNFFKKTNKIVVDAFCILDYAHDYTPVDYGSKFFPDWWKKTPGISDNGEAATIKNCVGVIDFYRKSLVIPSWFGMELTVHSKNDPKKRYYSYESTNQDTLDKDSHPQIQFENFALSNGHNLKLTSPWCLKTKEEIYWSWTQPTWNMRNNLNNFTVLPAVTNFKFQHSTNINFFVTNDEVEKKATIEPNTPLVMLHPMTEKEIELKHHLVDEKEFKRLQKIDSLFFLRNARENAKFYIAKKNYLEKMECPFKNEKS